MKNFRWILPSLFLLLASCQDDEDVIVQSLFDLSGAPLTYDDSKATRFLNVAAVSVEVSKVKPDNLRKIHSVSKQIKTSHPATELILFSETVLGWYIDDSDPVGYQRSVAETIPGPATDMIGALSDSLNTYISFGMTEIREGSLFNAQVLLNPNGELEAVHRKVHLTPEDKENQIQPSPKTPESVTVTTINDIRIGIIICADVSGFWLTEQLVKQKIELILHSMASEVAEFRIDPVSRQYNAWEVFANRVGNEGQRNYSGTVYVADPVGTKRTSETGKEFYVVHKVGVR
jgi:predicted amidohydrolase